MQEQQKDRKQRNRRVNKVIVPVLVIIILVLIVVLAGNAIANHKSAKYSATTGDNAISVMSDTTVGVSFHVKNIGSKAGSPTCTVNVNDPSYKYTGFSEAQLKSDLQPGDTATSAIEITVTHQGAQYITQAKVSCN